MADTFEDSWRRARLRLPGVPALLVRDWVQDAYTKACEYRGGGWAFLRKEASIDTLASRSLTLTFTQGSTTVTSAAAFVSTDAGRQIKVSSYPVYTIASVTDASTVVLDRNFAETGGAQTATIFNAYFVCPSDFKRFLIIYDPYYQRVLPYWYTQDHLGYEDPARRNTDTGPRYLVSQGYSTATATLGQVRYEYWPYPTAERHYPYLYYRKAERLADATTFPGVFSNREDLFVLGARLEASLWPGTAQQKNPYFNLGLADRLERQWNDRLQELSLADDNQYGEDYMVIDWAARYGPLTATTSLLRQTDATVNDYV
jgi:hypothetical protein